MHVELSHLLELFPKTHTQPHNVYKLGINFTSNNIRTSTNLLKFTIRVMCHSIYPLCLLTFESIVNHRWNICWALEILLLSLPLCHSPSLSLSPELSLHPNRFKLDFYQHHIYEIISTRFDDEIEIQRTSPTSPENHQIYTHRNE